MNILFRVDSSSQIGSGHLMRCLTLAGQLKKKYPTAQIYFIARRLTGNINQLISDNGYILLELPSMKPVEGLSGYEKWLTVKQATDASQTIEQIKQVGEIDKLIVDSYAIDELWEQAVRTYVKQIMVIDDLANRRHDCDILLDQNYYSDMNERYNGLVPKECKLLLGPKYALLREEFYEAKKHLRQRDGSVQNIFLFFGGSDLTNETMKALQAIAMLNRPDVEVNVVVGASNQHKSDVEKYCREKNFYYHCQVSNMAKLMNQADLAIGAGGTTTWERCFLELPSIVIAIADNQIRVCNDCKKIGAIEYLGYYTDVDAEIIKNAVVDLISLNLGINRFNKAIKVLNLDEKRGVIDGFYGL